jgi:hypothetical protein
MNTLRTENPKQSVYTGTRSSELRGSSLWSDETALCKLSVGKQTFYYPYSGIYRGNNITLPSLTMQGILVLPTNALWRQLSRRMPSSGMWCHVALVWTVVSEELIGPIINVEEISEPVVSYCLTFFSRQWLWRMACSGMLRRVALVRTPVSGELSASIIRVKRIGELGTTLAVTSNRHKLRRNTKLFLDHRFL